MQQRLVEIWVGLFVVVALAAMLFLSLQVSGLVEIRKSPGYQVSATFDNVAGLRERAQVQMAGVKIGRVETIRLDPQTHQARVVLNIDQRYDSIPADSRAAIYTSGLLGEQYIGIDPGWEDETLQPGDQFTETQSAVVLERLIGQFISSMGD
ncbi:outer membrane lipid asymmetry maintenance protein MlaD [Halorhodospira halochloris]|uniref:Uncharacterized ABC transporter n=1 Tax=Halorhodospira halochloris TaxID=1052 RepID=A0A0X8XCT7_HALHR|nr:outer membrane lipid asymmetry maintenance protein MlaD [Halorhodospira halochloris]MBK1651675.1 outer membrane lipid asymmetry maintenance protein MlaD [Halorhodospira halochloris]MCG5529597.1 outer membrane lipid asymmetry maintenance protein MlaD [Halorhodospira halochloris]MCG5548124.1 outer membrane lipid asymmetry maintenance protein MlaD [Halorhodospira halochloris]BAU58539.1 uncharacterized ABC transporter [Halorhodospira halochloris]